MLFWSSSSLNTFHLQNDSENFDSTRISPQLKNLDGKLI